MNNNKTSKKFVSNLQRIKKKSNNISLPRFKMPLEIPKHLLNMIDDVEISPDGTISSSIPWLQGLRENLFADPEANKMIIDMLNSTGSALKKTQKDKVDLLLNILERGETGNIIGKSVKKKEYKTNWNKGKEPVNFFDGNGEENEKVSLLDLNRYQPLDTNDAEEEEKIQSMEYSKKKPEKKNLNFLQKPPAYQFSPAMDILEHRRRVSEFNDLGVWRDGVKDEEMTLEDKVQLEHGGMKETAKPVNMGFLKELVSLALVIFFLKI